MAHIPCPYQESDGSPKDFVFSEWRIGLKHLGFQHRSETGRLITFNEGGRFQGSFTIPVQDGRQAEADGAVSRRAVQAWLDALNDGFNTSDLPLDEPTFVNKSAWDPNLLSASLSDGYCKVRVSEQSPPTADTQINPGELVQLGTPPRVYRYIQKTVVHTTPSYAADWFLLPGVLPRTPYGHPGKVTQIKFRMTNHVGQARRQSTRGPWTVEWEEVVA